jgi:acetolactate synthase-1/2/3 large subunit
VEYLFGLPGEEILDVLEALAGSRIRFVATRHEQGAAFMADAWGRLTGRAGVCLATLGPGATNLGTGIADANRDRAPLVAITGQAGRDRVHKEPHQYVDIMEALRPLTKWNSRIETPAVVAEVVRKAFKLAESEKPGACHVELPEDVAEEKADGAPLSTERARRPSPDRPALLAAARLIEEASFPLIFAGNGVIRGRAARELRALAWRHGIPVVHTFMAAGSMPYDDDLCLLSAGLQARDYVSCGFERADLIVAVSYDPVEYAPRFWNAVLRRCFERAGGSQAWAATLDDTRLGRAVAAMREHPEHAFTLTELAEIAGMSRTVFAARFAEALAQPPIEF